MPIVLAIPVLGLLGVAVWRDVATRTIPNFVSAAIAVVGIGVRASEGWYEVAVSLAAAAVLFLLLLACHARGAIGGGDVKLVTALALGLSPLQTYELVFLTALAGGVLAIAYLAAPRVLARARLPHLSRRGPILLRVLAIELRRMRRRGPLPYGVAIAVAGAFILLTPSGV